MKASVIREMTLEEVEEKFVDEQESLHKLKMHHAISPIENPLLIRQKRRDVARLKTELNRRNKETK